MKKVLLLKKNVLVVLLSGGAVAPAFAQSLNEVLQAVLSHPSVMAKQLDVTAAQRTSDATQLKYWGAAALTADVNHFNAGQFDGAFVQPNFATPTFNNNQVHLTASYNVPIDIFGVIKSNKELAQSNTQMATLAATQETLMQLHRATTAWVNLQALQEKQQALDLEYKRVSALQKRVIGEIAAGLASKVDLTLAKSEAARVASAKVILAGEQAQLQAVLEDALGAPLNIALTKQAVAIPAWQITDSTGTLHSKMAQTQVDIANQNAHLASLATRPNLSANAGITHYNDVRNGANLWFVGARLSVPLDPVSWRNTLAAQSKAAAANASSQAALRTVNTQMVQLKAQYDNALALIDASKAEVAARQDMVAVQKELTKAGLSTTEAALRAEKDLSEATFNLASAKASALTAWSAGQVLVGVAPEVYIEGLK